MNAQILVESAPKSQDAEAFQFLLKEIFEYKARDLAKLAGLVVQHADNFDVFCGASHIAVHTRGVTDARLLIITDNEA